jgi:hypothetical protein
MTSRESTDRVTYPRKDWLEALRYESVTVNVVLNLSRCSRKILARIYLLFLRILMVSSRILSWRTFVALDKTLGSLHRSWGTTYPGRISVVMREMEGFKPKFLSCFLRIGNRQALSKSELELANQRFSQLRGQIGQN